MKYRLTRDGVILAFALTAATFEIVKGGARATALTFLSGLLLAPIATRLDDARRNRNRKETP